LIVKATNTIFLLYLCFIAGSTLIAAMSRGTYRQDDKQHKQQSNPDQNFISEAVKGGKMEVDMGNIAKSNAQNKRVKAFAEMMIRDHTKANGELESLLKGKNYSPKKMDKEDNHMSALKNQKGRDFDRAYMKMMVKDHDKDIDLFTKESNSGKDNQLKDFARKTLPVLKTHLDSAKAIYSDLNKSTMY
jgi:putative membrane protein